MKYIIKFEFCAKKMIIEIKADSKEQAIQILKNRINIINIETIVENIPFNDIFGDIFKNFKL